MSETDVTPSAIISRKVRGLMAEAGLTQQELGRRIGLNQPVLSARLRGYTTWRIDELVNLAQALDVPLERILPLDELKAAS